MTNSATRLQFHTSRSSAILFAFSIIVLLAITGCSNNSDPHAEAATAASQNFMNAYYQNNSAKGGLAFTTGDAKAKIAKEVAAIEKSGVSPDSPSERPVVTLKLNGYKKTGDAQYRVMWNVQSSAGQAIKVTITMVKPSDSWLVAKFIEDDK